MLVRTDVRHDDRRKFSPDIHEKSLLFVQSCSLLADGQAGRIPRTRLGNVSSTEPFHELRLNHGCQITVEQRFLRRPEKVTNRTKNTLASCEDEKATGLWRLGGRMKSEKARASERKLSLALGTHWNGTRLTRVSCPRSPEEGSRGIVPAVPRGVGVTAKK